MPNQYFSPEGDLENYFATEHWLIDQWVGDTLWGWGANGFRSLGDFSSTAIRSLPVTTFAGGTNWRQVSSGGASTAAIKTDGTLWVWGRNSYISDGTFLGDNTATDKCTPVTTFAGGTNWKQVSCGSDGMAAVKTDGTLWVWGRNHVGQLGINTTTNRSTPVTTFAGGTDWKQVSFGYVSIAAIKTDGTLWQWGSRLANNNFREASTPITTFAGGTNWKQVSVGRFHTAAVKTDGTLWLWGDTTYGQLGNNTTFTQRSTPVTTFLGGTNWKQVSCSMGGMSGGDSTAAIKTDGTLWTWGRNYAGTLGDNTAITRCTPVTTFAGGTNWKQVSVGAFHISSIKTDGTLWTWGRNSYAQLGNNTTVPRSTPITTFLGGTNWKQVAGGNNNSIAITSGTDPTFFIA